MGVVSKRFLEVINDKLNITICVTTSGIVPLQLLNGSELLKIKIPVYSLNLTLQSSTRQYQENYLKNSLILQEASSK